MPPTPSPDPLLIKLVESESSFWDSSLWSGVLPVLGVIVGGLLAFLLTRLQDDRKAKRDLATHFIDQIVEHASKLTLSTEEFIRSAHVLADHLDQEDHVQRRQSELSHLQRISDGLEETVDDVVTAHSHLGLIAPRNLRETARTVGRAAAMVIITDEPSSEFIRESIDVIETSLKTFKADVRKFVGVVDPN